MGELSGLLVVRGVHVAIRKARQGGCWRQLSIWHGNPELPQVMHNVGRAADLVMNWAGHPQKWVKRWIGLGQWERKCKQWEEKLKASTALCPIMLTM